MDSCTPVIGSGCVAQVYLARMADGEVRHSNIAVTECDYMALKYDMYSKAYYMRSSLYLSGRPLSSPNYETQQRQLILFAICRYFHFRPWLLRSYTRS